MKSDGFGIITFKSTHHALRGESIFKNETIEFRIIPTPREISHSCGLSIRVKLQDMDRARDIVKESEMDIDGVFELVKDDEVNKVRKLD